MKHGMLSVLVIERDRAIRNALTARFRAEIVAESLDSCDRARARLKERKFDLIIFDADFMPSARMKAFQLLEKLTRKLPQIRVIVVSDFAELADFSAAWRSFERVERPLDHTLLFALVNVSLQEAPASAPTDYNNAVSPPPTELEGILAISLPMRFALQQVLEAAAVDAAVLISGVTGTGKDMVAAAIHKRSQRRYRPYVPVNMGAISHELIASELFGHEEGAFTGASEKHLGVFEQARGDSIFLDEITTMDEKSQISLLRVLETTAIRRVGGSKDIDVDVRVIAATNANLEEMVKARRFREDLYYRLDVFRIHLPPLRERPGDVSFLTNHFIGRFNALYKKNIRRAPAEIYQMLRAYPWPGNVRELKNVIQRAVVMAKGPELTLDLLPSRITAGPARAPVKGVASSPIHLGMSLDEVEREFILMTLASVTGNKAKAATSLKISRHTLYDKLKKYGVL
jgi:DNA-binding NtrC family response regulator